MPDGIDDIWNAKPSSSSNTQTDALKKAASVLGIDPLDLATVIDYETIGTYSPTIQGGKNNNYRGLIQFGREEYDKYKVGQNTTFESQLMNSVVPYFQDRFKSVGRETKGATLLDLYKTVNGGNPNVSENASDSTRIENGKVVRNTIGWHVQRMSKANRERALNKFFGNEVNNLWSNNQPQTNEVDSIWSASPQSNAATQDDVSQFMNEGSGGGVNTDNSALVNQKRNELLNAKTPQEKQRLTDEIFALEKGQVTPTNQGDITIKPLGTPTITNPNQAMPLKNDPFKDAPQANTSGGQTTQTTAQKLSFKDSDGADWTESDNQENVPAGYKRFGNLQTKQTRLIKPSDDGTTVADTQLDVPAWLSGKTKGAKFTDAALETNYNNFRTEYNLPDTEELRQKFLTGNQAVKAGTQKTVFTTEEQNTLGDYFNDSQLRNLQTQTPRIVSNQATVQPRQNSGQTQTRQTQFGEQQTGQTEEKPGYAQTTVGYNVTDVPMEKRPEAIFRQAVKNLGNTIYGRPLDDLQVELLTEEQRKKGGFVFWNDTNDVVDVSAMTSPTGEYTFSRDIENFRDILEQNRENLDKQRDKILGNAIENSVTGDLSEEEIADLEKKGIPRAKILAAQGVLSDNLTDEQINQLQTQFGLTREQIDEARQTGESFGEARAQRNKNREFYKLQNEYYLSDKYRTESGNDYSPAQASAAALLDTGVISKEKFDEINNRETEARTRIENNLRNPDYLTWLWEQGKENLLQTVDYLTKDYLSNGNTSNTIAGIKQRQQENAPSFISRGLGREFGGFENYEKFLRDNAGQEYNPLRLAKQAGRTFANFGGDIFTTLSVLDATNEKYNPAWTWLPENYRPSLRNAQNALEFISSLLSGREANYQPFGLDADKRGTAQIAQIIKESVGTDRYLDQTFIGGKLTPAISSGLTFLLGGYALKSVKYGAGILGAFTQVGSTYNQLRAAGVDEERARNWAIPLGGLLGGSEQLGLGGTANRMLAKLGGELGEDSIKTLTRSLIAFARETGKDAKHEFIEEFLQEWGQSTIGDAAIKAITAKNKSDGEKIWQFIADLPTQAVLKLPEATLAGVSGAILGGGSSAAVQTLNAVNSKINPPAVDYDLSTITLDGQKYYFPTDKAQTVETWQNALQELGAIENQIQTLRDSAKGKTIAEKREIVSEIRHLQQEADIIGKQEAVLRGEFADDLTLLDKPQTKEKPAEATEAGADVSQEKTQTDSVKKQYFSPAYGFVEKSANQENLKDGEVRVVAAEGEKAGNEIIVTEKSLVSGASAKPTAQGLSLDARTTAKPETKPETKNEAAPGTSVFIKDVGEGVIIKRENKKMFLVDFNPQTKKSGEKFFQSRKSVYARDLTFADGSPVIQSAVKPRSPKVKETVQLKPLEAAQNATESNEPAPRRNVPKTSGAQSGAIGKFSPENNEKTETVYTPDNRPLQISPRVIDDADILTSSDEGYPEILQPRNRESVASDVQIHEIAQNLIPAKLGDNVNVGDGRPIAVPVNVNGKTKYALLTGNGRTLAIRLARKNYGESAEKYTEFVKSKNLGETSANPVYIGVLDNSSIADEDLRDLAVKANTSQQAAMSPVEQAKIDAESLDKSLMSRFSLNDAGEVNTRENSGFVGEFFNRNVLPNERGALIDKDGVLTSDGINRIKRAIIAKAFGDTKVGLNVLSNIIESTDDAVKNITVALVRVAPRLADLKAAVEAGEAFPEIEITDEIASAFNQIADLRKQGKDVKTFLAQIDLPGAKGLSAFEKNLLELFDHYGRASRKLSDVLNNYLDGALESGNPNQGNMFGEKIIPDPLDLLTAANELFEEEHGVANEKRLKFTEFGQEKTEARSRGRVEEGNQKQAQETQSESDRRLSEGSGNKLEKEVADTIIEPATDKEIRVGDVIDMPLLVEGRVKEISGNIARVQNFNNREIKTFDLDEIQNAEKLPDTTASLADLKTWARAFSTYQEFKETIIENSKYNGVFFRRLREFDVQNFIKFWEEATGKTFTKPEQVSRWGNSDTRQNESSESGTESAHDAATSPLNDLPEPSEAQREAGNYKLGHINVGGLDISIEIPVGGERKGTNRQGKTWSRTMESHYGYIKRSVGADNENIDVFVKDKTPADFSGNVFIVDQIHPDTGKFDEHKIMLGFNSETEARAAYLANYAENWQGLGKITTMPFDEFKVWAGEEQSKPASNVEPKQATEKSITKNDKDNSATNPQKSDTSKNIDSPLYSLPPTSKKGEINLEKLYNKDGEFDYEQVKRIADKIENGDLIIRRLNRAEEAGRIAGGRRNVEASIIVGAETRTNQAQQGNRRPLRKEKLENNTRVEEHLEKYAKAEGIWFDYDEFEKNHQYLDSGDEAHVFEDSDKDFVIKLIDYDFGEHGISPQSFIDNRISLYNHLFPATKYELIGFTRDDGDGRFRFVLKQPFVIGEPPHPNQRRAYMKRVLGKDFEAHTPKQYTNADYHIWDLHLNNLAQSKNGNIFVFDVFLELNTPDRYLGGTREYEEFSIESASDKKETSAAQENQEKDTPLYSLPSTLAKSAPTFYSQLERTIQMKMPNRASAAQVRAILTNPNNQVKKEEFLWLGLDDFLSEKDGFTKAEILDFVRENNVQLEEVVKQDIKSDKPIFTPESLSRYNEINRRMDEAEAQGNNDLWSELDRERQSITGTVNPNRTKYSGYQLEGEKENYRELLLTMPSKPKGYSIVETGWKDTYKIIDANGKDVEYNENSQMTRLHDTKHSAEQKLQSLSKQGQYKSTHFDEPNILAHVRFNERTDADGNKVLFVEEIQSDWHQKGREKGYKDLNLGAWEKERANLLEKITEAQNKLYEIKQERRRVSELYLKTGDKELQKDNKRLVNEYSIEYAKLDELQQSADKLGKKISEFNIHSVPDAPFKKSWHELALKRIFRFAAENDFDKVAWTTGEQQNERYDLSTQIDTVKWRKITADGYKIEIIKDGNDYYPELKQPEIISAAVVEEILGKEIKEKIIHSSERSGKLEGDNLKIEGTGMKGFYDKILPSYAKKFGKKFGAKVETAEIAVKSRFKVEAEIGGFTAFAKDKPTDLWTPEKYFETKKEADKWVTDSIKEYGDWDDSHQQIHSLTITPKMRESVMSGQALFSLSPTDKARLNSITDEHIKVIESDYDLKDLLNARTSSVGNEFLVSPLAFRLIWAAHRKIFGNVPENGFLGAYHNPHQTKKVRDAIEEIILRSTDAETRKSGQTFLRRFDRATDSQHKDIRIIAATSKGESIKAARQEESAHQADYRTGLKHSVGKDVVLSSKDGQKAVIELQKGNYKEASNDVAAMEVIAKTFVPDETETGLTKEQKTDLQLVYLEKLLENGKTANEIDKEFSEISEIGKDFSYYAKQRESERELQRNSGIKKPNESTELSELPAESKSDERARQGIGGESDRYSGQQPRNLGRGFLEGTRSENVATIEPRKTFEGLQKNQTNNKPAKLFRFDFYNHNFYRGSLSEKVSQEVLYSRPPTEKESKILIAGKVLLDLANIPRSLKSSTDLSAPLRQGAVLTVTEPRLALKAFVAQVKSLKLKNYESFTRALNIHPYIELAEESGLYLSTLAGDSLSEREEAFMSKLVSDDKVFDHAAVEKARRALTLHVRASERAYVTYLDSMRIETFAKLAKEVHEYNVRKGKPDDIEQYKGLSKFINYATGRGDLGMLNDAVPVLNAIFFSPRYMASRFQLLNPAMYGKLPPGVRNIALRKMLSFSAATGLILLLFGLLGASVDWDDVESPDWLKIKFGDYRYDIGAGFIQPMRLISRLIHSAMGDKRGQKESGLIAKFLRSKLAPVPGSIVNLYLGKNYVGEEATLSGEVKQSFVPLVAKDLYDAAQKDGLTGILKITPAILGVGTGNYADKPDEKKESAQLAQQILKKSETGADISDDLENEKLTESDKKRVTLKVFGKATDAEIEIELGNADKAIEVFNKASKEEKELLIVPLSVKAERAESKESKEKYDKVLAPYADRMNELGKKYGDDMDRRFKK